MHEKLEKEEMSQNHEELEFEFMYMSLSNNLKQQQELGINITRNGML